jgi:hypothetical protein
MKHLKSFLKLTAVTLLTTATISTAQAQTSEMFGLGVILGDPSGLSGKMKWDAAHSVDMALAYSSGRRNGLQLHADYLWDRARTWGTTEGPIDMYYGLGGRIITYNNRHDNRDESLISIGPRGSIGVNFNINNPNLEFFGELAAILELAPSVGVDLDAGIGCRIRF